MKKSLCVLLLTLCVLLLTLPAFGQVSQLTAPDCQFEFRFNVVSGAITSTTSLSAQRLPLSPQGAGATQSIVGYDNRAQNCTTWQLVGQTQGVSTVSIELDQAPIAAGDVPGSWAVWANPAPGTVFPIATTGTLQASAFSYQPWVSVNLNSAGGTGTVYGRVYGWRPQAGQDMTAPGNSVVIAGFAFRHISTATNTQMKSTPGTLHTVTVNGGTAGVVTVVDTSASNCSGGTTLAVIETIGTTNPVTLTYDAATANGLCVTTAAASDVTVTFR